MLRDVNNDWGEFDEIVAKASTMPEQMQEGIAHVECLGDRVDVADRDVDRSNKEFPSNHFAAHSVWPGEGSGHGLTFGSLDGGNTVTGDSWSDDASAGSWGDNWSEYNYHADSHSDADWNESPWNGCEEDYGRLSYLPPWVEKVCFLQALVLKGLKCVFRGSMVGCW